MIFLNLIKSDDEMWIEIRKSLNLDQDSRKSHQMNMREISEIKITEERIIKLELTQITIQN